MPRFMLGERVKVNDRAIVQHTKQDSALINKPHTGQLVVW